MQVAVKYFTVQLGGARKRMCSYFARKKEREKEKDNRPKNILSLVRKKKSPKTFSAHLSSRPPICSFLRPSGRRKMDFRVYSDGIRIIPNWLLLTEKDIHTPFIKQKKLQPIFLLPSLYIKYPHDSISLKRSEIEGMKRTLPRFLFSAYFGNLRRRRKWRGNSHFHAAREWRIPDGFLSACTSIFSSIYSICMGPSPRKGKKNVSYDFVEISIHFPRWR